MWPQCPHRASDRIALWSICQQFQLPPHQWFSRSRPPSRRNEYSRHRFRWPAHRQLSILRAQFLKWFLWREWDTWSVQLPIIWNYFILQLQLASSIQSCSLLPRAVCGKMQTAELWACSTYFGRFIFLWNCSFQWMQPSVHALANWEITRLAKSRIQFRLFVTKSIASNLCISALPFLKPFLIKCIHWTAWTDLSRKKTILYWINGVLVIKTYPIPPKNRTENPYAGTEDQYTTEKCCVPTKGTIHILHCNHRPGGRSKIVKICLLWIIYLQL